ncbi:MAG: class I SAM-dependent methyltransferase [Acidimicrobiales bacterium]
MTPVRRAYRRSGLASPIALLLGGELVEQGWYRSFKTERPVDKNGRPLPWYTYPCRAFLESRLTPSMRVFEYGSGMSTLWYAERVAEVVSVEHDPEWGKIVREQAPANCKIVLTPNDDSYLHAITEYPPFDVVVVDGMQRPKAAIAALDGLKPDGVMVWDNSEWDEFNDAFPTLQTNGFKQIPFTGIGPVNRFAWETSVLYRDDNCLGI